MIYSIYDLYVLYHILSMNTLQCRLTVIYSIYDLYVLYHILYMNTLQCRPTALIEAAVADVSRTGPARLVSRLLEVYDALNEASFSARQQ